MNQLNNWKCAVIKVGSALIAPDGKRLSTRYLLSLADFIISSRQKGKSIVVVSSGSVAAGATLSEKLSSKKPRSIPEKQALAAIGQPQMMQHWQKLFDFPCAQVLLTKADLQNRQRYVNAKNTLKQLLDADVLPIVNENDSVAVDELKLGDNDNLAAHVAVLVDADMLIICSDVDGLYSADPQKNNQAEFLKKIEVVDANILAMASSSNNPLATGGMITKLQAAQKTTQSGIHTFIVNGTNADTFEQLKKGSNPGSWFKAATTPLAAKKHWLAHLQNKQGAIVVDAGAEKAILSSGASLLPSGIIALSGDFKQGEMVEVISEQSGQVLACGICQYSLEQLQKIKGKQSNQIVDILGYIQTEEVIHRNDLLLNDKS